MFRLCYKVPRKSFSFKDHVKKYCLQQKIMAYSSVSPDMLISNDKALVDERIDIIIKGLKAHQKVTLVASLKDDRAEMVSFAHLNASESGLIDLQKTPSLGGTYTGTDSMGLFWSLKSTKNIKPGIRLQKKDVTQPFRVNLSLLDGYQYIDTLIAKDNKSVMCTCDVERWYLSKNVDRQPIKAGRLRGTLFRPKGKGPFPGVIDLFGSAGGLIEFRAALLASKGFCVLALAFFAYDDLPPGIEFDYDYFDEAIQFMNSHPDVNDKGIGVVGVSKGGEIAMHMACHNTCVKVCAVIAGFSIYSFGSHTYKGRPIKMHELDYDTIEYTDEGAKFQVTFSDSGTADYIPLEKSGHCHMLFMQGDDDVNIGPNRSDELANILKRNGMSNFTVFNYPGAGHLIEPPYTPVNRTVYHKILGSNIMYGGNPVGHSKAQEHSWHTIIEQMKKYLGASDNYITGTSSKL